LSYFVTPGSVKLETKGPYNDVLAFVTPGGKIILVTINTSDKPANLKIKAGSKSFIVTLPPKSFNTLTV
jgi:O-glycosyl hydrolase